MAAIARARASSLRVLVRSRTRLLSAPAAVAVVVAASMALVIVLLAWPLLFTSSSMGQDWGRHLWLVWQQSLAIRSNHQPSLFVNLDGAVFYPIFAFYGGSIYALAGLLTVLLGEAPVEAYVLTYLAGFAAAYGGWYWLARMAGLGRWPAQVPGLVFITSAYYLTDVYGRGDWPEFIAISSVPLLIASGLHVLLADRLTPLPGIALAGSALVLFGSHSITMLWASTALGAIGLATVAVAPRSRRLITRRGMLRVAGVTVPAALVNAWYLLPTLVYGRATHIVQTWGYAHSLREYHYLVDARHLFTFSRATLTGPDFVTALPVLAVIWTLVGMALSLVYPSDGTWRRALWIFSAAAVLLGMLMTHPALVLALPAPYALLQFGYRLETWVLLSLSASILATLVLAKSWPRWGRRFSWTVVLVLIASGVGAISQVDSYPRSVSRSPIAAEFSRLYRNEQNGRGLVDYDDTSVSLVNPIGAPEVEFPSSGIHHDEVTVSTNLPAGRLMRTDLASAPYLISVTGASVVGRDSSGRMVLRMGSGTRTSKHQISLRPAHSLPVVVGRLITLLALLYLASFSVYLLLRRLRTTTRT